MANTLLLLGVDTCGPAGSVALASVVGGELKPLRQMELAGRSYSATLVEAVGKLLAQAEMRLAQLNAIVAVNGPGSFTGVRVGLSAVKGFAEPAKISVVAVSRLEVLAMKAAARAAALDAHRNEVFLRLADDAEETRESLVGREDLLQISPCGPMSVCDDSAEALLRAAWPEANLVRTAPPTAFDAITLALPRVLAGTFVDVALLDGHYLRRSDAEIFGEPEAATARPR